MTQAASSPPQGTQRPHWVVWDGDCGFCSRMIDLGMSKDKHGLLYAIPWQTAPSPPMTPRLRLWAQRAVIVLTPDGRAMRGGRACLRVLGLLGWPWIERIGSLPPFIWAFEIAYRIVAENRYLFSRLIFPTGSSGPACGVPTTPAQTAPTGPASAGPDR